jgi:hypothetical protein
MSPQFVVEATFALPSRRLFVAHGQILAGRVKTGQRVIAPTGIDAPVYAIEFLLKSAADGQENVALCFRYRDEDQRAQWRDLELAGQIIDLEDIGAA